MLDKFPVVAVLPVTDMNRAKQFYSQSLGLRVKTEYDADNVAFEAGKGSMLFLYKRPPVKVEHTQAGFWVENLGAVMQDLRAKGVKFEEYDFPGLKTVNGVATMGDLKSAWFKDPDGNTLAISQM